MVDALIGARNAARAAKNFKEADRIRGELDAMGIVLKDAKDPKTGELDHHLGGRPMKPLLGDLPFRNSRRVYLAIKLAVLALAVALALHFLFGVV